MLREEKSRSLSKIHDDATMTPSSAACPANLLNCLDLDPQARRSRVCQDAQEELWTVFFRTFLPIFLILCAFSMFFSAAQVRGEKNMLARVSEQKG